MWSQTARQRKTKVAKESRLHANQVLATKKNQEQIHGAYAVAQDTSCSTINNKKASTTAGLRFAG